MACGGGDEGKEWEDKESEEREYASKAANFGGREAGSALVDARS